MSTLIFRLNNVPDDEAADVRALLDQHGFAYHETTGGFLGFGVAGIWLLDDSHKAAARALIDVYQHERRARLISEYGALRRAGRAETLLQRFARRPVQSLLYITAAVAVLYLTLWPFLALIG